jgi:molybdopterin-guanine dinucleotide biosynthesis adapter protein
MNVFSVAGWSGSGKTTLIIRLIKYFKLRHKRVIAVKNVPHKYYVEPESSDTYRFLEAGADEACLTASKEILTMRAMADKADVFDFLYKQYANCDFLLLEGLRRRDIPLLEVYDSRKHDAMKFSIADLTAVVSDKPVTTAIPNFHYDDIEEISRFLEVFNG